MGLFDKLLKEGADALNKAAKEVASEENKEKASALFQSIKDSAKDLASEENKEKASALFQSIKDSAKEMTSEENKEKASAFLHSLKDSIEEHADDLKKAAEELKSEAEKYEPSSPADDDMYESDGRPCREKILEVLSAEFPQYTVKENVSPVTIGGTGRFMDYSIAVYDRETPKLFMMLIGKTTTAHREYRWSREEAEKNNIPFINFVEHYPNRPEYISGRLHKYL